MSARPGRNLPRTLLINFGYLVLAAGVLYFWDPFKWFVPGPEESAQIFLEAMEDGKWSKARRHALPETIEMIEQIEGLPGYPKRRMVYDYWYPETISTSHVLVFYKLGWDGEVMEINMHLSEKEWKAELSLEEVLVRDKEDFPGNGYYNGNSDKKEKHSKAKKEK